MALELRPNCECCDRDLPPAAEAYICTFECTFCPDCTKQTLKHVLPELRREPRPSSYPSAAKLAKNPPSAIRVHRDQPCVRA